MQVWNHNKNTNNKNNNEKKHLQNQRIFSLIRNPSAVPPGFSQVGPCSSVTGSPEHVAPRSYLLMAWAEMNFRLPRGRRQPFINGGMAEVVMLPCFLYTKRVLFTFFVPVKICVVFPAKKWWFFFQWISCVLPLSCLNIFLWWRFPPTQHLQLLHSLWWFFPQKKTKNNYPNSKKTKKKLDTRNFHHLRTKHTHFFGGDPHPANGGRATEPFTDERHIFCHDMWKCPKFLTTSRPDFHRKPLRNFESLVVLWMR